MQLQVAADLSLLIAMFIRDQISESSRSQISTYNVIEIVCRSFSTFLVDRLAHFHI